MSKIDERITETNNIAAFTFGLANALLLATAIDNPRIISLLKTMLKHKNSLQKQDKVLYKTIMQNLKNVECVIRREVTSN